MWSTFTDKVLQNGQIADPAHAIVFQMLRLCRKIEAAINGRSVDVVKTETNAAELATQLSEAPHRLHISLATALYSLKETVDTTIKAADQASGSTDTALQQLLATYMPPIKDICDIAISALDKMTPDTKTVASRALLELKLQQPLLRILLVDLNNAAQSTHIAAAQAEIVQAQTFVEMYHIESGAKTIGNFAYQIACDLIRRCNGDRDDHAADLLPFLAASVQVPSKATQRGLAMFPVTNVLKQQNNHQKYLEKLVARYVHLSSLCPQRPYVSLLSVIHADDRENAAAIDFILTIESKLLSGAGLSSHAKLASIEQTSAFYSKAGNTVAHAR
eukprot:jgi/Hompol1/303/HPOL_003379-RA